MSINKHLYVVIYLRIAIIRHFWYASYSSVQFLSLAIAATVISPSIFLS